jgi:hypothetical protein
MAHGLRPRSEPKMAAHNQPMCVLPTGIVCQ